MSLPNGQFSELNASFLFLNLMSDTVCERFKRGGCYSSLLFKREKLHAVCNFCSISSTKLQCVCLSDFGSSGGVSLEMKGHTKLIESHIKD